MKKTLFLTLLCLIPAISHTMDPFAFIGRTPEGRAHLNEMAQILQEQQETRKAAERAEREQQEYADRLAQQNPIQREVTRTLDGVEERLDSTLTRAKNIGNNLRQGVGHEARTTIRAAVGDAFKGTFCGIMALLGAFIIYKQTQSIEADNKKDENKAKKEKYLKIVLGATCIASAGILGHYWLS